MMSRLLTISLLLLTIITTLIASTNATIHDLNIEKDSRKHFFIENFGYVPGGVMDFTIKNMKIESTVHTTVTPTVAPMAQEDDPTPSDSGDKTTGDGKPQSKETPAPSSSEEKAWNVGFLIKETKTDASTFLEQNANIGCLFDYDEMGPNDIIIKMMNPGNWSYFHHNIVIPEGRSGFYHVFFTNCEKDTTATFELLLKQFNPGPDYLSVGDSNLPTMYGIIALCMGAMLCYWLYICYNSKNNLNRIHHLMTVLGVTKTLSLGAESMRYHFIKKTGDPAGWSFAFHFFTFLKGMLLFVIILLIGTGWSFVKPFLSVREKRIFMFVLPMQVLANIAMIVVDDNAPGSLSWLGWHDILRIVDVLCCCAVMVPIAWSIKHLRETVGQADKGDQGLKKLKLFQKFYMVVICYVYFTRIILYLLSATISYQYTWVHPFFDEAAAMMFYAWIGVNFRPVADNPYFALSQEDDDDDDVELNAMSVNGDPETTTTTTTAGEVGQGINRNNNRSD